MLKMIGVFVTGIVRFSPELLNTTPAKCRTWCEKEQWAHLPDESVFPDLEQDYYSSKLTLSKMQEVPLDRLNGDIILHMGVSYDFERWFPTTCMGFSRTPFPPMPLCDNPGLGQQGITLPHAGEQVHLGASLLDYGSCVLGVYGQVCTAFAVCA